MTVEIQRVAVLGSGVMGSGIAAHLANAGIETLLFDIVPREGKDRLAIVKNNLKALGKARPPQLFRADFASRITPCNYDDHADRLATCDWIVEVVVERLDIKQKVFGWVADNRREGSIVTSNTSGIKLADMAASMSDEMRSNFLVTHFFNPVRYMKLLELIPGPDTNPDVVAQLAQFGEERLGKGIVYGKDTPNFVANRIGTYGMASVFKHMARLGLTVEQVDGIFGKAMGRPSSAVFRTADLVGLDTLSHVFGNVFDNAHDDEEREAFVVPDYVTGLISAGRIGSKAGAGFYKKTKIDGKRAILVLDTDTLEYRAQEKVRFPCTGKARKAEKLQDKLRAMVYGDADDLAAQCAWAVMADTLIYSANRIPEIADDIVNVDRALTWGFGWDQGPFESWDAIGVRESVDKMEAEGRTVPRWVKDMLASGRESFYAPSGAGSTFRAIDGEARDVPTNENHLVLDQRRATSVVERNVGASLFDLGEGVLGLEFHTKMNALDENVIEMYTKALDKLDANEFESLVVGNQDSRAFCAGANVLMILMGAMQKDWDSIGNSLDSLQKLMMRAKYSSKPVVVAPHSLTLGGGAEVAMHSAVTVAASELYMGLVEVGVGLIPGAGGCKEMVVRYLGDVPQDIDYDPIPFVQKAFQRIGLAEVSSSAEDARAKGFLRPTDRVIMDSAAVLHHARKVAHGLAVTGYVAPARRTVKLPGPSALAAVELFLYQMVEGGFATPHDVTVGKALGKVLTGGDVPAGTVRTEQDLLDLEREVFLSLCGEEKSQARMQHMLQTGKPLRN
jgi:3-hydroxyacyl-CoA dehydrogenase